jgi:tetratricopeptide (TPR) repeat protein
MLTSSVAIKIVLCVCGGLTAILGILSKLRVTDELLLRFAWLRFEKRFRNEILIASAAITGCTAALAIILFFIPSEPPVETVLGPDDDLAQIASYAQFERELSSYPTSIKQEVRDYFRTGERNLQEGRFKEAVDAFRHADNSVQLPSIKLNLGTSLSFTRDLPQSIIALEEGLSLLAKRKQNPDIEALMRNTLGIAYADNGDADAAMRESQNVVNMAPHLHSPGVVANARTNIGNLFADKGDRSSALSQYGEALNIYTSLHDQSGVAQVDDDIGTLYSDCNCGEDDVAINYHMEAITAYGSDSVGRARALNNIGSIHAKTDIEKALAEYSQASALIKGSGYARLTLQFDNNTADALNGLGRYRDAETLLRGDLRDAPTGQYRHPVASMHVTLGNSLAGMMKYEDALKEYKTVEEIFRSMGAAEADVDNALVNEQEIYRLQGSHLLADRLGARLLEVSVSEGDYSTEGNALIELGESCFARRKDACAIASFTKAAGVGHKIVDNSIEGRASYGLAKEYLRSKRLRDTLTTAEYAVQLLSVDAYARAEAAAVIARTELDLGDRTRGCADLQIVAAQFQGIGDDHDAKEQRHLMVVNVCQRRVHRSS